MERPCALLALFAAILSTPASPALGELAGVLFPFAALVVCALPDTASCIIFAAEVSHNHAGPVLHICRVVSGGEPLDQGEDVEVVREQKLFLTLIVIFVVILEIGQRLRLQVIRVQAVYFLANLEVGYQVTFLKV